MVRHLTWTQEEDDALKEVVLQYKKQPNWAGVARKIGRRNIKKSAGQCKRR